VHGGSPLDQAGGPQPLELAPDPVGVKAQAPCEVRGGRGAARLLEEAEQAGARRLREHVRAA
jgi:hypothetical protein